MDKPNEASMFWLRRTAIEVHSKHIRQRLMLMGLALVISILCAGNSNAAERPIGPAILDSLTFYASYDSGPDADFSRGDKTLYSLAGKEVRVGVSSPEVSVAKDRGRWGGCLEFHQKQHPTHFYQAARNLHYPERDWNGTLSFWLNVAPDEDLERKYCDPIQITDKSALDRSLFVEFTKGHDPTRFRLAVCPDFEKWNPTKREWESIPLTERPVIEVEKPPFRRDRWTHVAFTFAGFNSGKPNGRARLYLDGKPAGEIDGRAQPYSWDLPRVRIMLGLAYIGRFDEFAIFDRELTTEEILLLFQQTESLKDALQVRRN